MWKNAGGEGGACDQSRTHQQWKTLDEGLTAKEVTAKTGCKKSNIWNAMGYRALVNGKYYIELVDKVLSRKRDKELLREWDRYRRCFLEAAGRGK